MVGTGGCGLGVGEWGLATLFVVSYSTLQSPPPNPPTSDVGQPFSNLHLMQFRAAFSVTASYCMEFLGMVLNTLQLLLFARRYTRGSDGIEDKEIHRDC